VKHEPNSLAQPLRITTTYEEHGKILSVIQQKRGDQAALLMRAHIQASQTEVRKITLHQVHLARQLGAHPSLNSSAD